jgi:TetR/AcrR family transcriptional regulator
VDETNDARRTARTPRRTPAPEERKLDAERSRRLLVEAAKDEFAAKGYAGARVQDIADRAGLNKQLITYYFGGKEGLYRELGRQWLQLEATFHDPAGPLDELVLRYLREAFADPRAARLQIWSGLTGERWDETAEDLSELRRRQAEGELAGDLDVATVLLLFMAAVCMPVAMPQAVRRIFTVEADSPEFQERYAAELGRIIRHLAPTPRP